MSTNDNTFVVYDLEIVKAIPDRKSARMPGIEYCEGWHDHAGMGVSVLCAYDSAAGSFHAYCGDNIREFWDLAASRSLLVGFNNIGFDDKVLETIAPLPPTPRFDILREMWLADGLEAEFRYPSHVGYSLDATLRANGIPLKTGHGELAPIDWQRGNIGSVINYCLQDVHRTLALFAQVLATGDLAHPKRHGETLSLRQPFPREREEAGPEVLDNPVAGD